MRIQLKQAVSLGGKNYARGIHDLPEQAMNDPFLERLKSAGLAVESEDLVPPVLESPIERNRRLAQKIASETPRLKAVEQAPPVQTDEESVKKPKAKASRR